MTESHGDDLTDDLARWADDDLVRALRAPGTATELADEERYVASYRDTAGSRVRSLTRRAGRLGAGGTAVVVTVAITSGVAAAYTGHLPDPVQQIAHSVIGAPAPDHENGLRTTTSPPGHGAVAPPSASGPGATTSAAPGSTPSGGTATDGPVPGKPGGSPAAGSDRPSAGATSTPGAGGSAAGMTMSAPAHRVGFGQTLTFTGLVTDASGVVLPDHATVLQVRGARRWRDVVPTTSDGSGAVTASTPAITRSARFRWKADRGVSSEAWAVRMVPALTASVDTGGSGTTIRVATQGTRAGDRVQVLRRTPTGPKRVGRGRLDSTGASGVTVRTPRRSTSYAVVLLPTSRHAAARTRVDVAPPAPAQLTISASSRRVPLGGTTLVSGVVTSASGSALPGHRVALLRRGASGWRPVGHAVSDADGQVSFTTPAIVASTAFRLRTDHRVHSAGWRVVEMPALTASARRDGSAVGVSASARGARTGDRVVLLRRSGGRLVTVAHGSLAADGSVGFQVPARRARTTYVVRLVATHHHGPATAKVSVPRSG